MLAPPPLPRSIAASFRDVESAHPEIRASAVADVVRHAGSDDGLRARAVTVLEARLADADPRVRAAACVGLADLSATGAVPSLVRAAEDDDAHVRQMALSALGELGDERAEPCLRRAIKDPRAEVRYQGLIAFTRVCSARAEVDQALLDATHDDDDAIVHIALRLAEEHIDARASRREPLVSDPRVVVRARALLDAPSPSVALVSAILLAKVGETSGQDLLFRVVRGEGLAGIEKEEEQAAVELMGTLGLTQAIPALERRAFGLSRLVRDTCAFHAKIALARMQHPRARAELLRELGSSRAAVRASAVVAAGRARLVDARPIIARMTRASVDPALVVEALSLIGEASRLEPAAEAPTHDAEGPSAKSSALGTDGA